MAQRRYCIDHGSPSRYSFLRQATPRMIGAGGLDMNIDRCLYILFNFSVTRVIVWHVSNIREEIRPATVRLWVTNACVIVWYIHCRVHGNPSSYFFMRRATPGMMGARFPRHDHLSRHDHSYMLIGYRLPLSRFVRTSAMVACRWRAVLSCSSVLRDPMYLRCFLIDSYMT